MLALCTSNAAYLTGLESALPKGKACLMAGTGAAITEMLRRGDRIAFALDEDPQMLAATEGYKISSGVVLGAAPVVQILEDFACDAVMPFKSGARLWTMAERLGVRVLATPHRLTRKLENKLMLAEIAEAADASIPDTVSVHLDQDLAKAALNGEIALPRVFQPAVSFGGTGTVLLEEGRQLAELVDSISKGHDIGKLVEYVAGDPVTINAVVIPSGVFGTSIDAMPTVLAGTVARQLTGIDKLTSSQFGSCGNDWTLPPDHHTIAAVRSLVTRVGQELGQRGFIGAFGIDVVLPENGGAPVLIEINPRWTASLSMQVEMQLQHKLPTLLDAHLAAFEYRVSERPSLEELLEVYGPQDDAKVSTTKFEPMSTIIAFNASDTDTYINRKLEPGIWQTNESGESIERIKDGWEIADLDNSSQMIILPQGSARAIKPCSHMLRVDMKAQVAKDRSATSLKDDVAKLMQLVLAAAVDK